jgi:nitroimidazol reductase NimA-like FMN-containing flavoprotein (pyridoxamine 5'-phosphate oxidase superfamily)
MSHAAAFRTPSPSASPIPHQGERSRLRVHAERAVPEEAADILAAGLVAQVGFAIDGQPFVIPMAYHFDPARPELIYLHGATHSRLMRHLATGAPVCLSVTLVDGLVYSRTALFHSVNYRSAVCFGRLAPEPSREERRALLQAMVARYFPGRTAGVDYDPIPDDHLDPTAFVALRLEEWSAKARRGGPKGPRDQDPSAPGTAGVVTL